MQKSTSMLYLKWTCKTNALVHIKMQQLLLRSPEKMPRDFCSKMMSMWNILKLLLRTLLELWNLIAVAKCFGRIFIFQTYVVFWWAGAFLSSFQNNFSNLIFNHLDVYLQLEVQSRWLMTKSILVVGVFSLKSWLKKKGLTGVWLFPQFPTEKKPTNTCVHSWTRIAKHVAQIGKLWNFYR